MRAVRLVVGREVTERLRGRTVWISTVAMVVLVVLAIVLPGALSGPAEPTTVGLVGPAGQLAPLLRAEARVEGVPVDVERLASVADAERAVRAGRLDVALQLTGGGATAVSASSLAARTTGLLQATLDTAHRVAALRGAGLSPSQVTAALRPVHLDQRRLHPGHTFQLGAYLAAFASGLLLYSLIALYGVGVAQSVAQEKTSRTAEVLLAALPARLLLIGKVIGVGVVGMAQVAVVVATALVANGVVHDTHLPASLWTAIPMALLWFVLGYALYSFICAAAGATVARPEEVQLAVTPYTLLLVLSYLLTFVVGAIGNTWWLAILSLLPPMAPVLLPARIAAVGVPWWQIGLAVALEVASIVAVARLAERIYVRTLLDTGGRVRMLAALRREGTGVGGAVG